MWKDAIERLHATNNFPEFTGWLCPAPCEDSCVLTINSDSPVTIKEIELDPSSSAPGMTAEWIRWRRPPPRVRTDRKVAVVGSGPAGLAAAQQLTRAGHAVTVFERDDRCGGLMRYGIPEFKMEKRFLDRRLEQSWRPMGSEFRTGVGRRRVDLDRRPPPRRTRRAAAWPAAPWPAPRSAGSGKRELRRHPLRDGVPDAAATGCRPKATTFPPPRPISRPGQAGGHHRRRRHRRRLPRHRAHRQGAAAVHAVRAAAPAAGPSAAADNPLAGPGRTSCTGCRRRTRKGGDRESTPSTTEALRRTPGDGRVARPCTAPIGSSSAASADGRMHVRAGSPGTDEEMDPVDLVLLAIGFSGAGAGSRLLERARRRD